MNIKLHRLVFSLHLFFMAPIYAKKIASPYFSIRSQGFNAPRRLVGQTLNTRINNDHTYGTLSIIPEYTQSFESDRINRCLFGQAITNDWSGVQVTGSRVANRGANDLLADYFYLPTDFASKITFQPRIDNFLVDLNWFIGLDDWYKGLYFAIYAPITHTRWDMNMCENVGTPGVQDHVPGFFTPAAMPRKNMLNNFNEYINGHALPPIAQTFNLPTPINATFNKTFTTSFQPLEHAKISNERLKRTRLADLRTVLGFDFVCNEDHRAGINVHISAPVGNRPEGAFLFEPMAGNGHHWELGIGINEHYHAWYCQDRDAEINLYFDATITHMFSASQKRTFDLKNGPLSRYMLAEKLSTPIENNLQGGGTSPSAQFKTEFNPVANLTNLSVDVTVGLQADIVFMSSMRYKNFTLDLGYNLWAKSCENIKIRGFNKLQNNTTWALKGDAQVFGFAAADEGGLDPNGLRQNAPVALSATERNATVFGGTNLPQSGAPDQATFDAGRVNPNIDSPQLATGGRTTAAGGSIVDLVINPIINPNDAPAQVNTSINPIFIRESDVEFCKSGTSGLSSKIFGHLNYTWKNRRRWTPFIGLGGEAEFGHKNFKVKKFVQTECQRCSLSQWGIWLQSGILFD